MMRRAPGLMLAAVLLGIGANTTIVGWARAFLLEPYPGVANQRALIVLGSTSASGEAQSLSYPDYRDLRDRVSSLQTVIAQETELAHLGGTSQPHAERVLTLILKHKLAGPHSGPYEG